MENANVFTIMYNVSKALIDLGNKLYEAFSTSVNIQWINKVINFFGAESPLPNELSLSWILFGASGVFIIGFIIFKLIAS